VAIAKRPDNPPPGATALDIPQDNGIYLADACTRDLKPLLLWPAIRPLIQQAFPAQSPSTTPISDLVYGPSELAWSPDGRYLLFQPALLSLSGTNDIGGVFSVPVAGGDPVYHGPMLHVWSLLDWFPGGHRFAFTLGQGRDMYWGKRIAVAEAGVPGATVIAEDPDRVPGVNANHTPMSARSDAWPVVSPDGRRIVFQASEARTDIVPRLDVGQIEGPEEGIWIANADGSNPRQLTSDPQYLDFFPEWSADGQSILFVRTDGKQYVNNGTASPNARAEIWIMRADGSSPRPIVNTMLRIGSYYGLFSWNMDLAWYRATK
jgi:dipeptidyl aminopeptidase/acylaminoacyl peptidase